MKRMLAWVLAAVCLWTVAPVGAALSEEETPKIYISYVPEYGVKEKIEGIVRGGADFDPSEYFLALVLQIQNMTGAICKPYYNRPYEPLSSDGVFTYLFCTGGVDETANVLTLYLIPAEYVASFQGSYLGFDPASAAIDTVVIERTETTVTVTPDRADPGAHTLRAAIPASSGKIGVNVGFYTNGQYPDSALPEGHIGRVLSAVVPFAHTVRFYRSSGAIASAYDEAAARGLRVAGMAYLDGSDQNNQKEMDALIALCRSGKVDLAIVGNELLLTRKMSEDKLIECIEYVRKGIAGTGIPVATSDSVDALLNSARVRYAVDVLMPNIYPYWGGCDDAQKGIEGFINSVYNLRKRSAGKQIVVSETMWPTQDSRDLGELAAAYFEGVRSWARARGIPVLFFEAADEPWKSSAEGAPGAHWGILDKDLKIKPCYQKTSLFGGIYPTEGVIVIPENTVEIGDSAFENCEGILEVHIPASVTRIGAHAFDGCGDIVIVSAVDSAAKTYAEEHGLRWKED